MAVSCNEMNYTSLHLVMSGQNIWHRVFFSLFFRKECSPPSCKDTRRWFLLTLDTIRRRSDRQCTHDQVKKYRVRTESESS